MSGIKNEFMGTWADQTGKVLCSFTVLSFLCFFILACSSQYIAANIQLTRAISSGIDGRNSCNSLFSIHYRQDCTMWEASTAVFDTAFNIQGMAAMVEISSPTIVQTR